MENHFSGQLTLPVHIRQDAELSHFEHTPNQQSAHMLLRALQDADETLVYLCGAKETGKTHLVSAVIQALEVQGRSIGYFAMNDLDEEDGDLSGLFGAMSSFELIVLENIDRWLKPGDRERALFNLFNACKQSGQQLLLTGRATPAALSLELPDLKSRLASGLLLHMVPLSDEQKQSVLKSLAKARGLEMHDELSSYIIRRSGRNMGQLVKVLNILDRASLKEKRRLTVPFAKKVLQW